jgi:heme iron utilization protein
MAEKINPIRETDAESIALARRLVSAAKYGALAFADPQTGAPSVSRVAVATDERGAPILLISDLSRHTQALNLDPRCALMAGEPGKGDPLAHPRVTLACIAERLARDGAEFDSICARFLAHQPKTALYIGFADFSFFRLVIQSAALNGGFGKAFNLTAADMLEQTARPPVE